MIGLLGRSHVAAAMFACSNLGLFVDECCIVLVLLMPSSAAKIRMEICKHTLVNINNDCCALQKKKKKSKE